MKFNSPDLDNYLADYGLTEDDMAFAPSRLPEVADLSSSIAFVIAAKAKKSPNVIAQEIIDFFPRRAYASLEYDVAKGFINARYRDH